MKVKVLKPGYFRVEWYEAGSVIDIDPDSAIALAQREMIVPIIDPLESSDPEIEEIV